ncbi:SUKH-4 family immunity protein [Amycolatopsis taiwanensis]|uniref:Uncharacterized protein n=1 Tax=Amycolatopsis taiwanensis TaxID=342230 RepID=A0A9W6VF87_9PSEU|nr:SUKH-4 family immunity protein [Amycolatopsis taiwanensis]GLY65227.1 hypothetical protein Atai01_18460 [Amycolatopsis taiwanensis]
MAEAASWGEFFKIWQANQLVPIEPNRLTNSPVPERTRQFLSGVGLPIEAPLYVTFYHDERLLKPTVFKGDFYLLVGDDSGNLLGLRNDTGELWSIDGSLEQAWFVNSTLCNFILFLGLYEKHYCDLEKYIIARDAKALEEPGNWWSIIMEQMGYGFL